VVFDAEKTEAILFSRRRSHKKLANETIKAAPGIEKNFNHEATRWLGVWLDSQLTLKERHNKMMNKVKEMSCVKNVYILYVCYYIIFSCII
jgi:hypothetical protein